MCLLVLSAPILAHAQNARFMGRVTDPQGAVVSDAEIQVVNEDTAVTFNTKTDAGGTFTVPYLAAGHYRVVVSAPGFATAVHSGVALRLCA
jgi:uncharacterized surface anchored protein